MHRTDRNEAIRHLREVSKDRIYNRPDKTLAEQLSLEALRYMYRLLFLFYIEARPELGYAPLDAEAYRKGYGLERLRDLELVRLTSEESLNGYYLHHSIQQLFRLIREGFDSAEDLFNPPHSGTDPQPPQPSVRPDGTPRTQTAPAPRSHGFNLRALDSRLFRRDATPLLNRVKLRNGVLQRVICLMSLTRPAQGRGGRKRRGRISYAQLGINQLGAVYEALLSYRGFFAEEDLYEVKKAGETQDDLASAFFVPQRDLNQYQDEERVHDRDEQGYRKLRVHPRGTFIYRLAGRDRQKSASYYTPESLTRTLVKHALGELTTDAIPADDILNLTVCEPAMGSAAFLNEAVNQLAECYLERKQRELGRRIEHADYADELRKVRRHIADRNVFGVDLNPVGAGAGGSVPVVERHPPRRPCALVRLPTDVRQLPGGRATAGVCAGEAGQRCPCLREGAQETGGLVVQQRAATGAARRLWHRPIQRPASAPARHRLPLPAARPRYGQLPRQGGQGAGSGELRAHPGMAQDLLPTLRGGGHRRTGNPVRPGGRTLGLARGATGPGPLGDRGHPARVGDSPPRSARVAPPTNGRTASAPRACSAKAPKRPAPTAA